MDGVEQPGEKYKIFFYNEKLPQTEKEIEIHKYFLARLYRATE